MRDPSKIDQPYERLRRRADVRWPGWSWTTGATGAVVIEGAGLPEGYDPPSGTLLPPEGRSL